MNRSELIKELANQCQCSTIQIKQTLTKLTDIITTELINGGKVKIDNLGSFYTTEYKERKIKRVNGNGETIDLAARMSPRFAPSQTLKNKLKSAG